MELLAKLGVDWKLLLAQVVNFSIILGVLSFFIYRPLLNLLDERRARIAKAMEDAKRIENQRTEMEAFRLQQMKKIDQEVGAFLQRAKGEAEVIKKQILDAAKKEAEHALAKGRQQLADERATVFHEVQGTLTSVIVRMTEKILEREFSDQDQKRLVTALQKELPSHLS
ncbi:F0F1 ATP synthase subunit B [Candidatus Peregrinibacteria bacterium]|nr:F0F1 ATP synthase subunit B [Candidatus Peregrinibacteria bacterium]MBI3816407.1 F0F1 ATP synthase subunit B [Candidatus Peregrinibacteria bacterium]